MASAAIATALGAFIGAAFFLSLSGLRFVDPTETAWAMRDDWATHYFGWKYFRNEPWQWPPGTIRGYYAPIGTSIGLTDALPLLAYLLKPFAAWLPRDFQYLGAWELLCFALQGAFAARLVARFTPHLMQRALAAALFVLLPILIWRVAHAALLSHWLLLWCLLIATRPPASTFRWGEWAVLGALAGMIQPYLAAMVAGLLAAIVLKHNGEAVFTRARAVLAAALTMLTGWWLSGMFNLGGTSGLTAGGLGVFSTNLLGPISPYGWSRLLPEWPPAGDGQLLEGVHYYGAGVLLLIAVAVVWTVTARFTGRQPGPPAVFPASVVFMGLILAAVAVSPRVTLGDRVLFDLTGPWAAPLALFRSTGRFLWPLTYLLLTWTIATLVRRGSVVVGTCLLSLGVAVQFYDLVDFHADRRATAHSAAFYEWHNPFASSRWPVIARQFRHLVLAPPPQCATAPVGSVSALWLASANGLTVNTGTLSRGSDVARARYCEELFAAIRAGRLDPSTLYVVSDAQAEVLGAAPAGADVVCGRIDDLTLCSTSGSAPAWLRYATPVR